jgi:hypothetical protein
MITAFTFLYYPSQHNNDQNLISHRRREWDFDNCYVVTDNKGKYKQTQQDPLLDDQCFYSTSSNGFFV